MEKEIQLYVNVDANGKIMNLQMGQKIIPEEEWHYFFWIDAAAAEDVYGHKVVIKNMEPKLVLKDAE